MPKAKSQIPRPAVGKSDDKPFVRQHDDETIIEIKVLDLKGKTMAEISKATGVPSTSVLRFLNQHKPDPRQSEAARKKQVAQHERLLGIAIQRLADESKGKGKSNANASSSRASSSKSAPLPAAKRVATTGSTSRDSPYANKASSIPTRTTRAAATSSQPAASSSKTTARTLTAQSRSKAIAEKEKEKEKTPSSGSKSRGSPYAKPTKPESKPASKTEQSSSRRRSTPVVEVRVTKGPRSSLSKTTSAGPFSSKPASTAAPARPLASGSRGVIVPKSSPAAAAPPAATNHRRTHSTTPLPIPEGLVESLPPAGKSKGKEKAVSPEPEEEAVAEEEAEDEVEQEQEQEQLIESITTEVDLVSQAVVDDALAAAEQSPASPHVNGATSSSPPIETPPPAETQAGNAPSPPAENVLEDISMAEPTLDTLGDLDDDEEREDLAVSSMLVEDTSTVPDAQDANLEEEEEPIEGGDGVAHEDTSPIEEEETVVEETTQESIVEKPSEPEPQDTDTEQQPEDTDMSAAESTEIAEDYVADISAAMEEAVQDLEAASGVETGVFSAELAQPEVEVEVEQELKIVVEETVIEPAVAEEEEAEVQGDKSPSVGDEEVDITGDLEMDEAEQTQDGQDDNLDAACLDADLSTAPVEGELAHETEDSPADHLSTAIKWPVAYPLNIGQEHISAASSLPEPYSELFGRHIWPVLPTA